MNMGQVSHLGQVGNLWYRTLEGQAPFNLLDKLTFHSLICNVTIDSQVSKRMEKIWLHLIKICNSKTYTLCKSILQWLKICNLGYMLITANKFHHQKHRDLQLMPWCDASLSSPCWKQVQQPYRLTVLPIFHFCPLISTATYTLCCLLSLFIQFLQPYSLP